MKASFSAVRSAVIPLCYVIVAAGGGGCGDDAPPPIPVPDATSDSPSSVGLDDECIGMAVCRDPYTCTTTTTSRRCSGQCTTDADCPDAEHRCAELREGRYCTLVEEAPSTFIQHPYRVANLNGLAVDVELTLDDLWDVTVPEDGLDFGNRGVEADERIAIRHEVWPQAGLPLEDALVDVYIMRSLRVPAMTVLTISGFRPVILLVKGEVVIDGMIAVMPERTPPGGGAAVTAIAGASGNGPGGGLFQAASGGGGASHCSEGGIGGGMAPPAASIYGSATNEPLQGGSSGAGAGGTMQFSGAGGAAFQISAGTFTLSSTGRIEMSALDDSRAGADPGELGGGGGSGGAILIQAQEVSVDGLLVADGGDGGTGADAGGTGASGDDAATGGISGGGGGGGFGYIRIDSETGATIAPTAGLSPPLTNECTTEGGLEPPVSRAPVPAACASSVGGDALERCELCTRRYCCDELVACDGATACAACRTTPGGAVCNIDEEFDALKSCLNQVCPSACLPIIDFYAAP